MTVSDTLREYAEEKIGNARKVLDLDQLDADGVRQVETNPAIANRCGCEVTIRTKGNVVRVEENEQDMFAAVDVAAAKVVRQLRNYKTRVIDRRIRSGAAEGGSIRTAPTGDVDFDALMEELSDDEIVRVKEIEFEPMTEEEALIEIDLLGHDFFAYTDRDTNAVCVLYRRDNGGYGLLKQITE
ncbi:MAG: ribosome-associated translation inhibitor RaiA [Eggerthellaceae bacterium]|nr:ribosome-associated translation inhibitor RaiA [Eggerthellaceae bacterium]